MDLQIRIRNFEDYKGRSDVKHNSWFRLSNRFLEDHEFFDFTPGEKLVWIYLLSLASQKNHGDIHVSYQHAHHVCRIERDVLFSGIEKLIKIKCIEKIRTRTLRGRYAHDTQTCATEHNITEQDKHNITEHEVCSEPTKSVTEPAAPSNISFKVSEKITMIISQDLINSWADTYPKEFLDLEIKKARSWILANKHKSPKKDWGRFLNSWFNRGWEAYRKTLSSNPTQMSPEEALEILGGFNVSA